MKLHRVQILEKKNPHILLPNFAEFRTCQTHAGTTLNSLIHNCACAQKQNLACSSLRAVHGVLNTWMQTTLDDWNSFELSVKNDVLCEQLASLFDNLTEIAREYNGQIFLMKSWFISFKALQKSQCAV